VCSSPRLIAAYHVLHRLSMPRHPPCALLRLISYLPTSVWIPTLGSSQYPAPLALGTVPAQPTHHPFISCQRAIGASENWWNSAGDYQKDFRGLVNQTSTRRSRKEVIQPQVPLRLPCYDFAPVTELTFGGCLLAVGPPTSGPPSFHGVTGGVYKARERIHRGVADPRLLAIPASCGRVAAHNPNLDRLFAISLPLPACDALYRPL
jgi:hypothetical protein